MSLYLKTGRQTESLLFVKRGLGFGRGRVLAKMTPTPCNLAVVNKVDIGKQTPIINIGIVAQSYIIIMLSKLKTLSMCREFGTCKQLCYTLDSLI